MNRAFLVAAAVMGVACSNSGETPSPDPTAPSTTSAGVGGSGGSTQTSSGGNSSTSSGAGGGVNEAKQGFVSGSRLRARYREGADGSREYIGFFDNMKGSNCHYYNATDGNTYCLPDASIQASITSGQYFADSSCLQQVGIIQDPCAASLDPMPTYFSVGTGCTKSGVRPVVGTTTNVYYYTTGNCAQTTVPIAFLLGPVEPVSGWVSADVKTE